MTKVCEWCNQEFEAKRKDSRYCKRDHYKSCENCGTEYQIKSMKYPKKTCSQKCSHALTGSNTSIETDKECEMCNKRFRPRSKNQRFCQNPHPAECFNCGDDIMPTLRNQLPERFSCKKKECRLLATKLSNMEKYGVENVSHREDVREKISSKRQSMTAEQKADALNKSRETTRERYGVDYANQSPVVREKTRRTNTERYGVSNPGMVEEFQQKAKTTSLKKYGVEHPFQSEDVKEKIRNANIEKYGVHHPRQHHEETRKKAEKTNLERYGSENVFASEDTKAKIRETVLKKYGVEHVAQSSEVKKTIREAFLRRYGVDNPYKAEEVKAAGRETNLEKYGFPYAFQNETVKAKGKATMMERYGVPNAFLIPGVMEKSVKANGKTVSKINLAWKKTLEDETGLVFEVEKRFGDRCFADLAYGDLLIDINPSVSHNNTIAYSHVVGFCKEEDCIKHPPKEPKYHQKRAQAAEREGKTLLQYFDWFDAEIFVEIVKAKLRLTPKRIPARKTQLRVITQAEANRFFAENHLMGRSNGQQFCVGLFHEDEIIHCQSYGPARFSKKAEWEAIRSCSKLGYQVTGGFSKCDKYFFSTINPESVVSYVDLSISQGQTDAMFNGWNLASINKPSATWVKMRGNNNYPEFIKDSAARRVSADRLLGFEVGDKYPRYDEDGKKITNDYVLASEGYMKVYDSGTKTFIWRKAESS